MHNYAFTHIQIIDAIKVIESCIKIKHKTEEKRKEGLLFFFVEFYVVENDKMMNQVFLAGC